MNNEEYKTKSDTAEYLIFEWQIKNIINSLT